MPKLTSIAALSAGFAARYPKAGSVDLQASGDDTINVEAAAFTGFAATSGKLVVVKATEHFFVAGQVITEGNLVEVPEADARHLVNIGKAELATDAEIAAAKKAK